MKPEPCETRPPSDFSASGAPPPKSLPSQGWVESDSSDRTLLMVSGRLSMNALNWSAAIGATVITPTTIATITTTSTTSAEIPRPTPKRSPARPSGSSRQASAVPATKGSSTGLSSLTTPQNTASATIQKITCRSSAIGPPPHPNSTQLNSTQLNSTQL